MLAKRGTFDSLNPLIVKGVSAEGIREYVYESLLARAYDEPFSLYGLIAESVETPDDRSFVEFTLSPEAKFSDGKPITVDDVIFSYELLRDHGRPNHRSYYQKVAKVEKTGERKVRFTFDGSGDREMPLIMGLMPVLPRHLIDPESFEKTSFAPPIGSGPYLVDEVKPGKSISLKRDPNYWGANLPVNRGQFNFDEIRFDYYRDSGSMFEAFKSGAIDVRPEDDPTRWTEGYNFPRGARRPRGQGGVSDRGAGRHVGARVQHAASALRRSARARGADQAVRLRVDQPHALSRPICAHRKLFRPLRAQLAWPRRRRARDGAARALRRRGEARDHGRHLRLPGERRHRREPRGAERGARAARAGRLPAGEAASSSTSTGEPFTFEILAATRAEERLLLTYARALKQVGIDARIRQVDSAQYQRRKQTYDFDMIQYDWPVSLSPGNEQSFRWGSDAAVTEGTSIMPASRAPASTP